MIVAITGKPGSGKTTIVEELVNTVDGVGFVTKEIREGRRRVGFLIVTSWGEEMTLARSGEEKKITVGRYGVYVENVDRLAVEMMKRMETADFLYVDEIGKMEMKSELFRRFVEKLLASDKKAVVTVPLVDFDPLVYEIKKSAVLTLNAENYWNRHGQAIEKIKKALELL